MVLKIKVTVEGRGLVPEKDHIEDHVHVKDHLLDIEKGQEKENVNAMGKYSYFHFPFSILFPILIIKLFR